MHNKTVIVTGASKGIGKAIAIAAAQDGYHVVVHYNKDRQGAEDTLAKVHAFGVEGRLLCLDTTDRQKCAAQ